MNGRRRIGTLVMLLGTVLFHSRVHAQGGQLDSSFGENGVFIHTWGEPSMNVSTITDMAVQPDGRIVLVGHVQGSGTTRAAISRLSVDGAFDNSFSFDGRILLEVDGNDDKARGVAVLPDGRIAVAGTSFSSSIQPGWVAVFNPDGTLDPDFGTNGVMRLSFLGVPFRLHAIVATGTAGHIAVAGTLGSTISVARLTDQGALDNSFSFDGMAAVAGIGTLDSWLVMSERSDGGLVLMANLEDGPYNNRAWCYLPDGSLDLSFGEEGFALGTGVLNAFQVRDLVQLADGRLLITAKDQTTGTSIDELVVLTPDGQPDASAGTDGMTTFIGSSALRMSEGMTISAGGTVFLPMQWYDGSFSHACVMRLTPQLEADYTFGLDGLAILPTPTVVIDASGYHRITSMGMQPNGRVVAAGYAGFDAMNFWSAACFTNDVGTTLHGAAVPAFGMEVNIDPAADLVHVVLYDGPPGKYSVRSFDARGALHQQPVDVILAPGGPTRIPIPLNGLANGMYLIAADGPDGRRSLPFNITHH